MMILTTPKIENLVKIEKLLPLFDIKKSFNSDLYYRGFNGTNDLLVRIIRKSSVEIGTILDQKEMSSLLNSRGECDEYVQCIYQNNLHSMISYFNGKKIIKGKFLKEIFSLSTDAWRIVFRDLVKIFYDEINNRILTLEEVLNLEKKNENNRTRN